MQRFTSWKNYLDVRWPLKDEQRDFLPDPDYLKTRPTITPKECQPLWWHMAIPDHEIARQRRDYLTGVQSKSRTHPNDWIYDQALVGKTMYFIMQNSTAKKPKQVSCHTSWHPGYVKPILVRQGRKEGKWLGLDDFKAIHPNPKSKSHQQPWLIIRGNDALRGRYCKAIKYIPEAQAYTVRLLDYDGGRLYDSNEMVEEIRIEDLNIAWVDPRFKEEVSRLNFYEPQRHTADTWSIQVDLSATADVGLGSS
jgi:hypothetical protein